MIVPIVTIRTQFVQFKLVTNCAICHIVRLLYLATAKWRFSHSPHTDCEPDNFPGNQDGESLISLGNLKKENLPLPTDGRQTKLSWKLPHIFWLSKNNGEDGQENKIQKARLASHD